MPCSPVGLTLHQHPCLTCVPTFCALHSASLFITLHPYPNHPLSLFITTSLTLHQHPYLPAYQPLRTNCLCPAQCLVCPAFLQSLALHEQSSLKSHPSSVIPACAAHHHSLHRHPCVTTSSILSHHIINLASCALLQFLDLKDRPIWEEPQVLGASLLAIFKCRV